MKKELTQHYASLAEYYNEIWFLTNGYRQWLVNWIVQDLDLHEDDTVVDLGGGTGFSAEMMYKKAGLNNDILCVDVCSGMLQEAQNRHGVSPVCVDAISFVQRDDIRYNKLLIKEAIHHFPERVKLFAGVSRQLSPEGKILIVTRPPRTEFPFFEAAHEAFERSQPHYNIFQQELEKVGFDVEVQIRSYPLSFHKTHWFQMLRQRFMSHLVSFTDEQLRIGLSEIEEQYKDAKILHFSDNLVFITGKKG